MALRGSEAIMTRFAIFAAALLVAGQVMAAPACGTKGAIYEGPDGARIIVGAAGTMTDQACEERVVAGTINGRTGFLLIPPAPRCQVSLASFESGNRADISSIRSIIRSTQWLPGRSPSPDVLRLDAGDREVFTPFGDYRRTNCPES
jgi:hypothetical protein